MPRELRMPYFAVQVKEVCLTTETHVGTIKDLFGRPAWVAGVAAFCPPSTCSLSTDAGSSYILPSIVTSVAQVMRVSWEMMSKDTSYAAAAAAATAGRDGLLRRGKMANPVRIRRTAAQR